ncbi:DUF2339 domain-containing protein [Tsuneonella sp. YG55]|uniref:DUF2339 domain-containing protein n=1 Tax=Tsuneonella litorea TaxID=2976475 RepID=A0A9X2W2Q2_9SPHN|nr:DUF2339 domain-containing protein [Tsuneonella litorea]MCT2559499.1 DUF2339 domain-containing protein [Tsuneonella litorea]
MMELVVLALMGAVAFVWRRVDGLERELAALRGRLQMGDLSRAEPVAATAAAPPAAVQLGAEDTGPQGLEIAPASGPTELYQESGRPRRSLPRFDFEDLFGRLLPIWAGGVTLAAAGFFLVRWSIDAGLLTPVVRVLLAGLFGIALVAGAEAAFRWRELVADPRVAQALAGAGLATLYAAFYLAGSAYGLIGSGFAFLGLAAVTAGAIGLSFRFGLPSAVLALVGGFAAPALVGGEDANLPLLTLYLALVTTGLAVTGRRQDRAWMGVAALAGGIGWGALLIAGGTTDVPDVAVLGAYLVLLGAVVPALSGGGGRPHWLVRVSAAGLAALQLAALVQQGGFGTLEWGLYLMLGVALAWFGWREPAMREANAVAAAVGVALLALWPQAGAQPFAVVAAGIAAIFALVPLGQLWRGHGRAVDVAQASGVSLGLAAATHLRFIDGLADVPSPAAALALAAAAALAACAAALAQRAMGADRRWAWAAQAAAALVAYDALAQVLPESVLPWAVAIAAAALAWRMGQVIGAIATLWAIAALWALDPLGHWAGAGLDGLVGQPIMRADLPSLRALALYLLPFAAASAAWRGAGVSAVSFRRILETASLAGFLVIVHVTYRAAFAGAAGSDFVRTGVVERAGWEALLFAGAWLARGRGWTRAALVLAIGALAHFVWFAFALHNPLWSAQAVGPLPLANALAAMYAAGIAALVLVRRLLPDDPPWLRWAVDGATMVVLAFLAVSELRQAFAGSLLAGQPVTPAEALLRSLTGIVLAVGFLLWGSRGRGGRAWRVGSLVAMLFAVLKVFLVDAAGLAGLGRVASFMALGFSLIGIGWFYNRQLWGRSEATALP